MAQKRMETQKQKIPERLQQIRRDRTQRAFARDLGVFQQNVNRYERGEALPGAEFLMTLALKEGVSLDWFLLGQGPMRRRP